VVTENNLTYKSFKLVYPVIGFVGAAILWFIMFSPLTAPHVNFWFTMSCSAASLTLYSIILRRSELQPAFQIKSSDIIIGFGAAVFLYGLFFLGNTISHMLFSFAGQQVSGVYATKSQANTAVIGMLLLLLIGPAEEIFWRGFAQEQLMQRFGLWKGFFMTTLVYTLVHVPSLNFMLIMAALIAGLFWGWMYLKFRRLAPCIISHAVWDCVIFAILPITQ
jgi:membrane protease YdiL (CAAX protease family)